MKIRVFGQAGPGGAVEAAMNVNVGMAADATATFNRSFK